MITIESAQAEIEKHVREGLKIRAPYPGICRTILRRPFPSTGVDIIFEQDEYAYGLGPLIGESVRRVAILRAVMQESQLDAKVAPMIGVSPEDSDNGGLMSVISLPMSLRNVKVWLSLSNYCLYVLDASKKVVPARHAGRLVLGPAVMLAARPSQLRNSGGTAKKHFPDGPNPELKWSPLSSMAASKVEALTSYSTDDLQRLGIL